MTERTAVPERVSQRAKTARRRGGLGSQAVGDYVGQPAGEAAQAVRRAGLRPGLDRSFGAPAELIGLVVAQDPVAGSDLARNGMVTLYVAAPGDEPPGGDADTAATASGESDEKQAAPEPIEDAPSPLPAMPVRARRRRKPGHAHRPVALVETPPPPAPAVEATPPAHSPALPTVEPPAQSPVASDGATGEDELADELGEREFPHEDFVVHVEDVLAGRSGPPGWRRAYPRRRARHRLGSNGRLRAWLGEHRLLAGAVAVALVLWTLVGVASTGHHERTSSANAVAPGHAPSTRRPGPALPAAAQKLNAHKTARSPSLHPTRREWHAARPRRIPRPAPGPARPAAPAVRETVARPPREAPAPQPSEAPTPTPTAASAPPAAAPEQRGGGLFSP